MLDKRIIRVCQWNGFIAISGFLTGLNGVMQSFPQDGEKLQHPANYGDKAIRAASKREMSVSVIT